MDRLEMSVELPVSYLVLYRAWLDAREHSAFTGAKATIDPRVGGAFTAWDGYISGTTVEIEPDTRIVQAWRTSEFPPDAEDSRLELIFEPLGYGSRLLLRQIFIPAGQGEKYREGWDEFYFRPMQRYFASGQRARPSAAEKAAKKPPKKAAKKATKKAAKKAAKKVAKKTSKKTAARKSSKRPAKRTKARRRA